MFQELTNATAMRISLTLFGDDPHAYDASGLRTDELCEAPVEERAKHVARDPLRRTGTCCEGEDVRRRQRVNETPKPSWRQPQMKSSTTGWVLLENAS